MITTLLYYHAFHDDPLQHGWTWIPSTSGGGMAFVASEGWYPDKGGQLRSPRIPASLDPYVFYRLRFRSRTHEQGYWAVLTQDSTGADQVDDNYSSIHPSHDWLDNEVVIRNRNGAATLSIAFQGRAPIAVSELTVEVINAAEAAVWADHVYAGLPPLTWTPPAERWTHLPRTQARLRAGGELRIVQLGDSIINDTNNGNWDALVGRTWPQTRLRIVTSVRGRTGCWFYQQPEHFASYVTSHMPDLLLIGGISNDLNISTNAALMDLRTVVLRARDRLGCEIVLMSGPIGDDWRQYDPAVPEAWLSTQEPPPVPEFYLGMEAMAVELGVAFIDCHRAWHQYLGASQQPWQWFHRDSIHANDRGKQIVARMLERWFTHEA